MHRLTVLACALLVGCTASHPLDHPIDVDASPHDSVGVCAVPCARDSDCDVEEACHAGACEWVGCATDADCPSGHGCDAPSRHCMPTCSDAVPCPTDAGAEGPVVCLDGLCRHRGCPSDAWCREQMDEGPHARFRCQRHAREEVKRCDRVCVSDADCHSSDNRHPAHCRYGYCVFEACAADAECAEWHDARFTCVR